MNAANHAFRIDDERHAFGVPEQSERVVRATQIPRRIGQKAKRQRVASGEIAVRLHRIGGHSKHLGVEGRKLRKPVAERARLRGAPARFVFWIEVQDDPAATKVGEASALAVLVERVESRSRIANVDHVRFQRRCRI